MASVVVVVAGAAVAVTVPFMALKEVLEKRMRHNFHNHLGRQNTKCRVNFGNVDEMYANQYANKKITLCKIKEETAVGVKTGYPSSDEEDRASEISSPPNYDDLFNHPPTYDITTTDIIKA